MVHRKVFAVPIVYERTWLLYAAYYEKQGLMF